MKYSFMRYVCVVVLIVATIFAAITYYRSGMYTGVSNIPLPSYPTGNDYLNIIWTAGLLVGLKYAIYDLVGGRIIKNAVNRAPRIVHYTAYGLALACDLLIVWSANQPISDSGLVLLAAIFYTPAILVIGLIISSVMARRSVPPAS